MMVGTSLSHYRILEELGRGGMGVVYKAEDTKLDRTVAIKVLPSAALASEDEKVRFYREAKAAAKLHHPNIASVFEIDEAVPSDAPHGTDPSPFIAMEFIEGETLEARIKRGPMKLDEAVRMATQIGQALEAAHEEGIVHRDIKAQNVMLTKKGDAKVLDFGLALTAQSTKLTRMGSTLGTVAYMSPEQARGEEVDSRTDIWALGVTLYEMIAGRHPFAGDYEQAVVYSILNEDPEPLTAVRTGVPMGLEWIISKMMAKKAEHRYQSVTEALVDLQTVDLTQTGMSRLSSAHSVYGLTAVKQSWAARLFKDTKSAWPLILAVVALTAAVTYYGSKPAIEEPIPLTYPLAIPGMRWIGSPTISPGGDRMAFRGADSSGTVGLFEYDLSQGRLNSFRDSGTDSDPQYSPNGQYVVGRALRWEGINLYGAGGQKLGRIPNTKDSLNLPIWLTDETILASNEQGQVVQIGRDGAIGSTVISLADSSTSDMPQVGYKDLSADRKLLLVEVLDANSSKIVLVDLASGKPFLLKKDACHPQFVGEEYVVYTNVGAAGCDGLTVVQYLDLESRELTGLPIPLFENQSAGSIGVGKNGSMVRSSSETSGRVLVKISLDGERKPTSVSGTSQFWDHPKISPDGTRLITLEDDRLPTRTIRILNVETKKTSELLREDSLFTPRWSFDQKYVYYGKAEKGRLSILKRRSDGSDRIGQADTVYTGTDRFFLSPDGRLLAYENVRDPRRILTTVKNYYGLSVLNLETREHTVVDAENWIGTASFSGDGRYVAFTRGEGIYVRDLLGPGEWLLVPEGRSPRWDYIHGKIYFSIQSNQESGGGALYSIEVGVEPRFPVESEAILEFDNAIRTLYSIDYERNIAYGITDRIIDRNGSDAKLELTEHFDKVVQRLFVDQ